MNQKATPVQNETTERSSAGRVFTELAVRLHQASRSGDKERVERLDALTAGLEVEFPKEIAAEKEFWK